MNAARAAGGPEGLRRRLSLVGPVLLLCTALAGCGVRVTRVYQTDTQRAVATLSLLTDQAEAVRPLSAIAGKFHEIHPGSEIQISLLTGESNFFALLSTKFAVGDSPDLMVSQPDSDVALYAHGSYLMDITDVARGAERRWPRPEGAFFVDSAGRAFALPLEMTSSGLLVNLDLLKRYGVVEPPRTFPEFLADCEVLRTRGLEHPLVLAGSDGIELLQFLKQYMMENVYSSDPSFADQIVSGRRSWNSLAVRRAFAAFAEVRRCANPDALQIGRNEAIHRFAHGDAAFAIEAGNVLRFVHRIAPNVDARLVSPPWTDRAVSGEDFLGIGSIAYASELSLRPGSVLDFLRYLSSPKIAERYAHAIGGEWPRSGGGPALDGASLGASHAGGDVTLAGEWDPSMEWLPGFDIAFGHLVQAWYAGRGTSSVLRSLQAVQVKLARTNPDFTREVIAYAE